MKQKRKLLVSIMAGILAAIMVLSLILSILPMTASALSSSEIQNQIDELEEEQAKLQEQMDELKIQMEQNKNEMADIVAQKSNIDQQIALLSAKIGSINEQIDASRKSWMLRRSAWQSSTRRIKSGSVPWKKTAASLTGLSCSKPTVSLISWTG